MFFNRKKSNSKNIISNTISDKEYDLLISKYETKICNFVKSNNISDMKFKKSILSFENDCVLNANEIKKKIKNKEINKEEFVIKGIIRKLKGDYFVFEEFYEKLYLDFDKIFLNKSLKAKYVLDKFIVQEFLSYHLGMDLYQYVNNCMKLISNKIKI